MPLGKLMQGNRRWRLGPYCNCPEDMPPGFIVIYSRMEKRNGVLTGVSYETLEILISENAEIIVFNISQNVFGISFFLHSVF